MIFHTFQPRCAPRLFFWPLGRHQFTFQHRQVPPLNSPKDVILFIHSFTVAISIMQSPPPSLHCDTLYISQLYKLVGQWRIETCFYSFLFAEQTPVFCKIKYASLKNNE